jgi:hypothetical protein
LPDWIVKVPGLIEVLMVGVTTVSVNGADVLAA